MKDRFRFTPEQWAAVEPLIGKLEGVDIVTVDDGRFHFVALFDQETLKDFQSSVAPAQPGHVKAYLEGGLFAVRSWIKAKEVTGKIGADYRRIEKSARTLLGDLPPIEDDAFPSVVQSKELRSLLHALAAYASEMGGDVEEMLRNPSHRPKLAAYKVQYWTDLMRFWVTVLRKPATNSPYGPLPNFINAASVPASDLLRPSVEQAYEFVKKYRSSVWGGEKGSA